MGSPRRRTDEAPEDLDDDVDDDWAPPLPRPAPTQAVAVRRARQVVAAAPLAESRSEARSEARTTQRSVAATPASEPTYARGRELAALLFVAGALFVALALASYDERGGLDWVGPVGAWFAHVLVSAIGIVAWAIPVELLLFAIPFLRARPSVITSARLAGDVVLGVTSAALVHVGAAGRVVFGGLPAGGAIGELCGELLRALFSTIGTFLVGSTVIALVLIARAAWSFIEFANRASATSAAAASKAAASMKGVADAWHQARDLERAEGARPRILEGDEAAPLFPADLDDRPSVPEVATGDRSEVRPRSELRVRDDGRVPPEAHAIARVLATGGADPASDPRIAPAIVLGGDLAKSTADSASGGELDGSALLAASPEPPRTKRRSGDAPKTARRRADRSTPAAAEDGAEDLPKKLPEVVTPMIAAPSPEAAVQRAASAAVDGERAVERDEVATDDVEILANDPIEVRASSEADFAEGSSITPIEADGDDAEELDAEQLDAEAGPRAGVARGHAAGASPSPPATAIVEHESPPPPPRREPPRPRPRVFALPSIDLLEPPPSDVAGIDREALLRDARALVETLATYKVVGEVKEIHPGPVVTTFELEPRIGTKVREVEGLANDLRLSLAKESVRIVAPIPGKNRIGFELPNAQRIPVNFRELVEDRRFEGAKGALPVVLGRDIVGAPIYEDLAAMPHLLVAGATGAGKSVGLNVMLTSLLYRRTPDDLRMIMIDPKVVELAPFDKIPHMLLPVVTDMKQALNALKWCVDEMERRYQLLAQAGVKNITTYNAWRDKVVAGVVPNPCPKTTTAWDHNGLPETIVDKDGSLGGEQQYPEKLPYLVVVVDEFADLMMSVGKGEVEPPIARLAQKARAAGIHVILATQRPSVDVITGMIKANFPTRIAFRVAQRVDSRTILDAQGAEYLLGKGDMLASINGKQGLKRIQCPFVSEEEVQQVCDFLRSQGEPVFDTSILAPRDEDGAEDEVEDQLSPKDQELYERCVEIVREARKCSTSWLQRKMGLGYNKAARFVDRMERQGVVGPPVGAGKDREILG
jgi:S-DNA-T family DNA segregation ATPase FtsK/SpoIIIE